MQFKQQNTRTQWLFILGGWLLLSLVTAGQRYISARRNPNDPSFLMNFALTAIIWLFWAAATPLVFWLGQRFPLQRKSLARVLPLHLGFSLLFSVAHFAFWAGVMVMVEHYRTGKSGTFGEAFLYIAQILFYVEVILYWAILGAGQAQQAFREARAREAKAQALEAQLQQAQLSALKQQLQPHFLFNALNTIAMLVRNGENPQAVQMIAGLGELLRWSLQETSAQEVTLAQELEAVRRYLAIEQFRFPDRLRVEVNVPEELVHALVPNLLLQPLVENAVRHGIAQSSSASLARIRAARDNDSLLLTVEDDGPGFPADWQPGVGLRNTRARLQQLYGAQATMTTEANTPHGARVQLRLPWHET